MKVKLTATASDIVKFYPVFVQYKWVKRKRNFLCLYMWFQLDIDNWVEGNEEEEEGNLWKCTICH